MFWTKLDYGVAAGAAGVTTLNAITYLDMAVRAPVQRHSLSGGGAAGPECAKRVADRRVRNVRRAVHDDILRVVPGGADNEVAVLGRSPSAEAIMRPSSYGSMTPGSILAADE